MTTASRRWTVTLPDGTQRALPDPYGLTTELALPGGQGRAEIVLSPINLRIQVTGYEGADLGALGRALVELAGANGYGKVWIKARKSDAAAFSEAGFRSEAELPRFWYGREDGAVLSHFLTPERGRWGGEAEEQEILRMAFEGVEPGTAAPPRDLPPGYTSAIMTPEEAEDLAGLYREVFATYPFAVDDPEYLRETARTHISYRLVRDAEGRLVGAASAECAPKKLNAEMTDFAVLPNQRGKGLAQWLLPRLEQDARERFGIVTFYTIARAKELGMLRTFAKGNYELTGTLVNNCSIAGQFETMHVLTKRP